MLPIPDVTDFLSLRARIWMIYANLHKKTADESMSHDSSAP
jgi:hypothetical protein